MVILNLPQYDFKINRGAQRKQIFDTIRKKYVALTPEEWVRQHFVRFLVEEKSFPASLLAIEMSITINKMSRRCDVVAHDSHGQPLLIVECKAPEVKINQEVFDQIARYNMKLKVKHLIVTNGLSHYYCVINHNLNTYSFVKELPNYLSL